MRKSMGQCPRFLRCFRVEQVPVPLQLLLACFPFASAGRFPCFKAPRTLSRCGHCWFVGHVTLILCTQYPPCSAPTIYRVVHPLSNV
jgi:hypothetical protein